MEKLKFLETMTVEEFKSKMSVNKIEVKQNPYTGKCFFVYGVETGAVSEKFINGEIPTPVISQVTCSICSIRKGMEEHQHWLLCNAVS